MYRLVNNNSLLVLFLSASLLAGCSAPSSGKPNSVKTQSHVDDRYPISEIETIYDIVLDGMTKEYFKNVPEIDKEHTDRLRAYIVKVYPRDVFVKQMIPSKYAKILERGMREYPYRTTKEFTDALSIVINVSVPMAKMIIGGHRDVYVAAYIEKNPVKVQLLAMASTDDERQFVSWISGEAPIGLVAKEAPKEYVPVAGDKLYAFCSPESTWTDLCGRQGYLVVRGAKIVQVIVTMMN